MLVVGATRFAGIVRDVSPAGLFVQTRPKLTANTVLEVLFPAEDDRLEITVRARVVRRREVPPRLQASVTGGVGLEILEAPPAFQDLVAKELVEVCEGNEWIPREEPASPPPVRTYRVRVAEQGRTRSRVLTIHAESKHSARARALARAGRGWKVTEVDEA
jgi:hypothetical protein